MRVYAVALTLPPPCPPLTMPSSRLSRTIGDDVPERFRTYGSGVHHGGRDRWLPLSHPAQRVHAQASAGAPAVMLASCAFFALMRPMYNDKTKEN